MSELSVENLSVRIKDKFILKNCSFTFESNRFYVIFGKSGSGKTTFLKVLSNLFPFNGKIKLNTEDISNLNPFRYRRTVLYMQQEPVLFQGTVLENIRFPFKLRLNKNEELDEDKLYSYLDLTGLEKDILNKNSEKLSGGEKQRVCLIRSLMLNPDFLLLDEPTSALDMGMEGEIIKILKKVETTVIAVSHSKTLIESADKAILLSDCNLKETNKLGKDEIIKALGYE